MEQSLILAETTFTDGRPKGDQLKEKWTNIEKTDNVFRYKLHVESHKILSGKLHLFVEYNPYRTALRRKPQIITSIVPSFNENEFNFNKIHENEILFDIDSEDSTMAVTFLINNSPLTKYHILLVPRRKENLPQILTRESMAFALQLLIDLNEKHFRVGYNSPGALASVNHLHLHLLYIEQHLFIEDVELHHLVKNIYRISDEYPSKGYCFLLNESMDNKKEILNDIAKLIQYFCTECIPHNMFCTKGNSKDGNGKVLKIFVFPREKMETTKEFTSFNVAFCELSGYIPTGCPKTFEEITEDLVIEKIKDTCGNILAEIESNVIQLYINE